MAVAISGQLSPKDKHSNHKAIGAPFCGWR
jgi:hypothetical protein